MPDWVKTQIDFDDYVDYLKPPVGTWNGKIYRVTIDGDCHTLNFRTDVFADAELAKQWADVKDKAGLDDLGPAEDLAAGAGGDEVPQGQEGRRQGRLRLPRPAERAGAASASTSSAAAPRPTPSIRARRPGCSTRT